MRDRTTQTTEYRVSPLDEHEDIIDVFFYESKREALKAKPLVLKEYPNAAGWLFEKNVRKYASDGELLDDEYTDLGDY